MSTVAFDYDMLLKAHTAQDSHYGVVFAWLLLQARDSIRGERTLPTPTYAPDDNNTLAIRIAFPRRPPGLVERSLAHMLAYEVVAAAVGQRRTTLMVVGNESVIKYVRGAVAKMVGDIRECPARLAAQTKYALRWRTTAGQRIVVHFAIDFVQLRIIVADALYVAQTTLKRPVVQTIDDMLDERRRILWLHAGDEPRDDAVARRFRVAHTPSPDK